MSGSSLVILDYGSQYTQLIARRGRELGVYSIILPFSASLDQIKKHNPKGIVLSGGPNSVFDENAPSLTEGILDQNIPVLGICYGMQLIAQSLGGEVEESKTREYGKAMIVHKDKSDLINKAFDGSTVWMSHGTHVSRPPESFIVTAMSNEIMAAIENPDKKLYGLQFHPEVAHTEYGPEILEAFIDKCGFAKDWSASSIIDEQVNKIKETVGSANVICALSGGVDSSVAATLVNKAIGDKQTCIFVDTGLLRKNEYDEVLEIYKDRGLNVKPIKAGGRFLTRLKDISDPEEKRKIIGDEFIKIFEEEAGKIPNVSYLIQGTLYPDVIESVSVNGPSVTIKSHHNVGGLPEKMNLQLIEPLRELFKDEVREIGAELGLPEKITQRQPFPGPGLAVRIIDKITPEAIAVLQEADAIVREEVINANAEKNLWQYFAVLLPVKSVGVMGDGRTHEQVIAIRAVESTDGMTANWSKLPYELLGKISGRIVSEVRGVNRVVYDVTSKPPGTIEWE
ncbi:MAG TPA: glutamine-hydrolyzing GMP synthase [Candidatus Saccharimonadales bacterium]|nr:glutamine-hydrolyzing GMP synthase [Candidatus Saccharimonadales bacterium]